MSALPAPAALTPAARDLTELLRERRRNLIVYLPAGYAPLPQVYEQAQGIIAAGAAVLEVGLPHLPAPLDGPHIQQAYRLAASRGAGVAETIRLVRLLSRIRTVPVVVMSYWAPIVRYGPERVCRQLAAAGAAGIMVADLPQEREESWARLARQVGVHAPMFVARTVSDERLDALTRLATGWIYVPAVLGPSGSRSGFSPDPVAAHLARVRQRTATPVVLGIGISTPRRAALLARLTPAVGGLVIGSAVVRSLTAARPSTTGLVQRFAEAVTHPAACLLGPPSHRRPPSVPTVETTESGAHK